MESSLPYFSSLLSSYKAFLLFHPSPFFCSSWLRFFSFPRDPSCHLLPLILLCQNLCHFYPFFSLMRPFDTFLCDSFRWHGLLITFFPCCRASNLFAFALPVSDWLISSSPPLSQAVVFLSIIVGLCFLVLSRVFHHSGLSLASLDVFPFPLDLRCFPSSPQRASGMWCAFFIHVFSFPVPPSLLSWASSSPLLFSWCFWASLTSPFSRGLFISEPVRGSMLTTPSSLFSFPYLGDSPSLVWCSPLTPLPFFVQILLKSRSFSLGFSSSFSLPPW